MTERSDTTFHLPRTCTEIGEHQSLPLDAFRAVDSYVLLGDPGSGKTRALEKEALESAGLFISARDFLTLEPRDEWKSQTLFIDGLDETRAGDGDKRPALDRVRSRLDKLGRPKFRLSCREADWLAGSDSEALTKVSRSASVTTLHIDPLTDDQIMDYLDHHLGRGKGAPFVAAAQKHNLEPLLCNPQTLGLLAKAMQGDRWPDSRASMYELACERLAREENKEHRAARGSSRPPLEAVLDAAGFVCATALISDTPHISFENGRIDSLLLELLTPPEPLPLVDVVASRLFTSSDGHHFSPVHRSVSEYLAARYLSRLVTNAGLPIGRVISLMVGAYGGVVSGLRGLHAWLAVCAPLHRSVLIANDPLGIVLYGDPSTFSVSEKVEVLAGLHTQAKEYAGFRWHQWAALPFASLCSPDMAVEFRRILTDDSRSQSDQALVDCVIDALNHGEPIGELEGTLLNVVRDADRWAGIRRGALHAYQRIANTDATGELQLLQEIVDGQLDDTDDELLGALLENLYPDHVGPNSILDFLHVPKDQHLLGGYLRFWSRTLLNKTEGSGFEKLLDQLAKKRDVLEDHGRDFHLRAMAGKLVSTGIEECGDDVTDERLLTWLSVGLDKYDHPNIDSKHSRRIQEWFDKRPDRYKGVLGTCAKGCAGSDNVRYCLFKCLEHLYRAKCPNDLGLWFLEQSESAKCKDLGRQNFIDAVTCLFNDSGAQGMSLEGLFEWVGDHPAYKAELEAQLCWEIPEWRWEQATQARSTEEKREKSLGERTRFYRDHLESIREGIAHPRILHELGAAYFGHYYEAPGDSPIERLQNFLGFEDELVQGALSGFRQSLLRDDLPTVKEIIDLELDERMHYIRLPCIAGVEEIGRSNVDQILSLPDTTLERLVCFNYTYLSGREDCWLEAIATHSPEVIARVLEELAIRLIRNADTNVAGLYSIATDQAFANVATQIAIPILKRFPARAGKGQASNLQYLLEAAIKHSDPDSFLSLVAEKLSIRGLSVWQRAYWLACGVIKNPEEYGPIARSWVKQGRRRAEAMATLLHGDRGLISQVGLSDETIGLLIELFGPISESQWPREAGWVSPAMQTADLVRSLIDKLGGSESLEAAELLQQLNENAALSEWHGALERARYSQKITRREALFAHPSFSDVQSTLANLAPANAADLSALVHSHLIELGENIRHGNTNTYKLFWNTSRYGRPDEPKVEDDCRDALLELLRGRLKPLDIDAQPEGYYADDKRADIRVSFAGTGGFNVPIEIKREMHPDLWSAMHSQLIKKYTRDPDANGNGIYLVFWYGGERATTPPKGADKPASAKELQDQLVAMLSSEERRLIRVCVVDVSKSE